MRRNRGRCAVCDRDVALCRSGHPVGHRPTRIEDYDGLICRGVNLVAGPRSVVLSRSAAAHSAEGTKP